MKRWWAYPLVLLTLALSAQEPKPAIDATRRDLESVESRLRDLEHDLNARRGSRAVLSGELERLERDIAQLARAGRQLDEMLDEQSRALGRLEQRLHEERRALERERAALAGLVRSAHALGAGERIRLLLDQEDVARMGRVLSYYGYLNRYRVQRLEAVRVSTRRLEALRLQALEETQRLAMLAASQEDTRLRLEEAQALRSRLLKDLEETRVTREQRVAALKEDARGLRGLVEQLERRAMALPEADVTQEPIERARGRLDWPLAESRLIHRFGRPKGDSGQQWDGVVLAAAEGMEVRAVHHGRVAYADWLRGFGLLVIIEHDDGYMTLYGHNQALLKEPGEWVAAGDVIALSGSSGGRRSAGLYFAIRHRGRPVDPEVWCGAQAGKRRRGASLSAPPAGFAERRADSPICLLYTSDAADDRT